MTDKEKEKEGVPDQTSNYTNKIKEKIKEIDSQINTKITIPQYTKHLKSQLAKLPYYYYRENKEHYMSIMEHLSKKYEFNPYIYKELEMNEGYEYGSRHIYPHSSGCAQCSHRPVYANPHDPYRPNPPVLNHRCNQNILRRWIEFTELDENYVLREEMQDEWNVYQQQYVPVVTHQAVMHRSDARRLVYLMQNENFVYDDFAGKTTQYVQSYFTYDQPKPIQVDNSFARMVAARKAAIHQRKYGEEEEIAANEQREAEKKIESEKQQQAQLIEQLQEQLKQSNLTNKQIIEELKNIRSQGYSQRVIQLNQGGKSGPSNNEYNYYITSTQGRKTGPQYNENEEENFDMSGMKRFETKFEKEKQSKQEDGDQGNFNNGTFSNKVNNLNQKGVSQSQIQANQLHGSEDGQRLSSKVLQAPSQTDIEKKYNPKFAVKPSSQALSLKTYDTRQESAEREAFSQQQQQQQAQAASNSNIQLKTFNQQGQQQAQTKTTTTTQVQTTQQTQMRKESSYQASETSQQRKTFSYIGVQSLSQMGGKKLQPSSVIKLKTRSQLPNYHDEYYDHNVSPTHAKEEFEDDPQIQSFSKLEVQENRAKFIEYNNQRASQTQLSQHFDSYNHSQTSLHDIQKQSSYQSQGLHFGQQVHQEVNEEAENTPAHYNQS